MQLLWRLAVRRLAPVGGVLLLAMAASATSIETTLTPFTGSPLSVQIVLTEVGGDIRFDVAVTEGVGDLRGVFFDFGSPLLLDGLSASGPLVTGFATGSVIDLGLGNNLQGGGSPCPCDVGVALGTPGIGKDDLQSASFVLSHATTDLTVALLAGQVLGVRATSVGALGDDREGSSKLVGTFPGQPIPEPSTALLFGLGIAAVGAERRRRRGSAAQSARASP